MRHPGFDWVVSPTMDWHTKAPDAYHWVAYEPDGTRHHGYTNTQGQGEAEALHTLAVAKQARSIDSI